MAAFSVHQVRQLYVVSPDQGNAFEALAEPGNIVVKTTKSGDIYFQYIGALGDKMGSDLVKVRNIKKVNIASAEDIAYKLKGYKVTLKPEVNGGAPVAGQDYLLRIAYREYVGLSPEDQYFQYGMVHATSGMTAVDFCKLMAISIAENLATDVNPLVTTYMHSPTGGMIEVTNLTKKESLDRYSDLDAAVYLVEAAQPWHLGIMKQGVIPFTIQFLPVTVDGDKVLWGEVENYQPLDADDKPLTLPEGQLIADLEWFCMGERGDQFRLVGWPNVIPTKYMTDPSKNYDVITIHYAFQGDGMENQYSEKDIQLAVPFEDTHDAANGLLDKINAAIKSINPDWVDVEGIE